jgi:predicted transposase YbfD/YdcC
VGGLALMFADVDDPRADNARHKLPEVLFIALAAVICGAQTCSDMALFGRAKEQILRRFLSLPHGVPSHDTFSRVFRVLDPESFAALLGRFTNAFGQAARAYGVVAIDGKACRRGYEAGKAYAPPVMVSAWGADLRVTLAMAPAENGAEVNAAMEMVELLDLAGAIVTADALHCHRRMAAAAIMFWRSRVISRVFCVTRRLVWTQRQEARRRRRQKKKRMVASSGVRRVSSWPETWRQIMIFLSSPRSSASIRSATARSSDVSFCHPR